MPDQRRIDSRHLAQQLLGTAVAQMTEQDDGVDLIPQSRNQLAHGRDRIADIERLIVAAQGNELVAGIDHAADPEANPGPLGASGIRFGLDVRSGQVVDMAEAGVYDPAAAIKTAVQAAIRGAALALTTDVVIHHLRPPVTSPLYPSYAELQRAMGRKP